MTDITLGIWGRNTGTYSEAPTATTPGKEDNCCLVLQIYALRIKTPLPGP